jgi:hypothetical protein
MPIRSKKQQRLMYATLNGADTGVSKEVAKDFIEATPKKKFTKLREKVSGKKKQESEK